MTASTTTYSSGVDVRMSLGGTKYCMAIFRDASTRERVQNPDEMCGHAGKLDTRNVAGRSIVRFQIELDFTRETLNYLMPKLALGAGPAFAITDQIPKWDLGIDKVAQIHKYTDTRIVKYLLRGQKGSMPTRLVMDCVAADETEDAGFTFTDGTASPVFAFINTSMTAGSGPALNLSPDRFALLVDHKAVVEWNNSRTITDVTVGAQTVLLAYSNPYLASNKDLLYWDALADTVQTPHTLSLTDGTNTLAFDMQSCDPYPKSPDAEGKPKEVRLEQTWEAYRSIISGPTDVPSLQATLTP